MAAPAGLLFCPAWFAAKTEPLTRIAMPCREAARHKSEPVPGNGLSRRMDTYPEAESDAGPLQLRVYGNGATACGTFHRSL